MFATESAIIDELYSELQSGGRIYIHVFTKKHTHSRFLLYLCGKCLDFHKIFRECLGGNRHSTGEKTGEKIKYSLLLVMSYCHYIFMLVNYRFYIKDRHLIKCFIW